MEDHGKLAGLEEPFHHLCAAEIASIDEHLRKPRVLVPQHALKLSPERRVHGHVTLVDPNPKSPEYHPHGVAILVGPSDSPEARQVHHDPVLRSR